MVGRGGERATRPRQRSQAQLIPTSGNIQPSKNKMQQQRPRRPQPPLDDENKNLQGERGRGTWGHAKVEGGMRECRGWGGCVGWGEGRGAHGSRNHCFCPDFVSGGKKSKKRGNK